MAAWWQKFGTEEVPDSRAAILQWAIPNCAARQRKWWSMGQIAARRRKRWSMGRILQHVDVHGGG